MGMHNKVIDCQSLYPHPNCLAQKHVLQQIQLRCFPQRGQPNSQTGWDSLALCTDYSVFLLTEYITTLNRRAVYCWFFRRSYKICEDKDKVYPTHPHGPKSAEQDQIQRKHYFF